MYDIWKQIIRLSVSKLLGYYEGTTYAERIEEISQALKSSISYAGGKDLSAFKSVEWERILPS